MFAGFSTPCFFCRLRPVVPTGEWVFQKNLQRVPWRRQVKSASLVGGIGHVVSMFFHGLGGKSPPLFPLSVLTGTARINDWVGPGGTS